VPSSGQHQSASSMPPPLHCVGPVCVFSHAGLRWISCLVCTSAWSVWPGFMLCCFWSGCVVSHFFRKRGRAPACCGGLGCVALMGWVALFSVALFSHQKQAERTYTGGEVGGRLRTSSSVLNLGRAFFSLGKKKPKHTILYKEKCILCARTTLLLPVCRRERAADRSFNGTFLGLCILALHICPPSPPFKEVRVPNQSTKDRRAKTEAPHFTPFFTSPRCLLPPREPQFFCVLLCYPLLCDPGWFY